MAISPSEFLIVICYIHEKVTVVYIVAGCQTKTQPLATAELALRYGSYPGDESIACNRDYANDPENLAVILTIVAGDEQKNNAAKVARRPSHTCD